MKIVLIGAGNVGFHFAQALRNSGAELLQIFNRSLRPAQVLSQLTMDTPFTTEYENIKPNADLYIIAVSDDKIESVASKVSAHTGKEIFLVHTSGAVSTESLAPFAQSYGAFYPLQTFSKAVALDFTTIPMCLTANSPQNLALLQQLGQQIGCPTYLISDEQRKVLHVASVFACNFTNYLLGVSKSLLEEGKIAPEITHPLIRETIRKALRFDPREVQTGPAVRGDIQTMEAHLKLLEGRPDLQRIYRLLSAGISHLRS